MTVDISIVVEKVPDWLENCISYCTSRNVICQVIDSLKKAKGEFICIIDDIDKFYFHEYYLHICWRKLYTNKLYNNLIVQSLTVYDCVHDEFYTGTYKNVFFRRGKNRGPDKVLEKVILGCTSILLPIKGILEIPDDQVLDTYFNHLTDNLE